MTTIRLAKLHGAGNDFLVSLPSSDGPSSDGVDDALAARVCDRHRGVGADGLIVVLPGRDGADCTMRLQNADGGRAEMSGNGIRCLAWVANRAGLGDGKRLTVDTDAGRREVELELDGGGDVTAAIVDMGPVTFEPAEIPLDAPSPFELEATFHGVTYRGDAVGIGNPHLVLLVDDPAEARVIQHGPRLEHDERFPNATNVEFVSVTDDNELTMRVWERGVGETLTCGTGVCAAAAVTRRRGLVGDTVAVRVPGGEHRVELGETVRLHGPVVHVFDTEVEL
ncbi:MAG TPA: diaminopimelate epimerase [Acidimicrobiia bacterium]|nr:diaminopimelate epimerase [Acidimicrobiia bacterium]